MSKKTPDWPETLTRRAQRLSQTQGGPSDDEFKVPQRTSPLGHSARKSDVIIRCAALLPLLSLRALSPPGAREVAPRWVGGGDHRDHHDAADVDPSARRGPPAR